MKIESFASSEPLKKGGQDMTQDGSTRSITVQSFAGEIPISNKPNNLLPLNTDTRPITVQSFGEQAPISRTPMHGWQSDKMLGMSPRDEKQSK